MNTTSKKITFIIFYALSSSYIFSNDLKLSNIISELNTRIGIQNTLKSLEGANDTILKNKMVIDAIKRIALDKQFSKNDRLKAIEFINDVLVAQEFMTPDQMAKEFLPLILEEKSPSIQTSLMTKILSLPEIKASKLESDIENLVIDVISDTTSTIKKRKYTELLHSLCIEAAGAQYNSAKISKALIELIRDPEKLSAPVRIAVFKAIGNIVSTDFKSFNAKDSITISNALLKSIENNPALLPLPASIAELESLKASLNSLRHFLKLSTSSTVIIDGKKVIAKLLTHYDKDIVTIAGQSLIELMASHIKNRELNNIVDSFVTAITNKESQHKIILIEQLTHLESILLGSQDKAHQEIVSKILSISTTIYDKYKKEYKLVALNSFFNLNPSLFEEKLLSKESTEIVKNFFEKALSQISDKKSQQDNPELNQKLIEIMFEMTGNKFDTDINLWNDWYRKEGKNFF